jgi:putative acyl-CoA dehydrogenase
MATHEVQNQPPPLADAHVSALDAALDPAGVGLEEGEGQARRLVERLVLALQGALLVRHGPEREAEAFCASRLAPDRGRTFATLPSDVDVEAILARAWP